MFNPWTIYNVDKTIHKEKCLDAQKYEQSEFNSKKSKKTPDHRDDGTSTWMNVS